jgi:hypothetical protein
MWRCEASSIFRQVEKLTSEQRTEFYQLSRKEALLTVADNLVKAAGDSLLTVADDLGKAGGDSAQSSRQSG